MSQPAGEHKQSIVLNTSPVAIRLREIADSLFLESSRVAHGIDALLHKRPVEPMARAVADLNAAIEPYVTEIAKLTGNSEGALRDGFAPKKGELLMQWFRTPSATEFLRGVAQFESFDRKAWRAKGWQGFGEHDELSDEAHTKRRAAVADAARPVDAVEVFHWHVDQRLYNKTIGQPLQAAIYGVMRGDIDVIVDTLSDAAHWKDLGLTWRKVADVDGADFGRAFERTNHIDRDWTGNPRVSRDDASAPADTPRSTSVGDLMRVGGNLRVVSSFGFDPLPGACTLWLNEACEIGKPARKPRP